jgi:hypothetical protein
MFISMACGFCRKPLEFQERHSGDTHFDLYICRDCQAPKHQTLYRQLYNKQGFVLLCDYVRIDEWFITRYYRPTSKGSKSNYSIIFKEAIGIIDGSVDMEPISLNKPVCEVDCILDLPLNDIELLKHKLSIWTTFS